MVKLHFNVYFILIGFTFILCGCPKINFPSEKIGDQVWTIENYNGTHYQNGDSIPEVQNAAEWEKLTTGAWCYYNNDINNGKKYGKLYNSYALNDKRGFAPKGWHIPTNMDWKNLVAFLGGDAVAASAMKSTQGWNGGGNGTNSSKLNCLPGGLKSALAFSAIGDQGIWWTSTKDSTGYLIISIVNSEGSVYQSNAVNNAGISVRFIKDK